jgi:hypothetical protein
MQAAFGGEQEPADAGCFFVDQAAAPGFALPCYARLDATLMQ